MYFIKVFNNARERLDNHIIRVYNFWKLIYVIKLLAPAVEEDNAFLPEYGVYEGDNLIQILPNTMTLDNLQLYLRLEYGIKPGFLQRTYEIIRKLYIRITTKKPPTILSPEEILKLKQDVQARFKNRRY
jgi:hypothetical protein